LGDELENGVEANESDDVLLRVSSHHATGGGCDDEGGQNAEATDAVGYFGWP